MQHEFERLTGMKEKMVSLLYGAGRKRSVFKMKDAKGPRQAMGLLAGRQVNVSQ